MKTIKFMPHLVELILAGKKSSTWRLFDDKDLSEGDALIFVNKETGEEFGTGKITKVAMRVLGGLTDADWEGHERFVSEEEMYATYKKYYGDRVSPETEVKIIGFEFAKK